MQLKKIQMSILSASLTALMCSSVVQASDLQIYAMPTAGKKTLVMMLDTSGSMGHGVGYSGNDSYSIKEDYGVCSDKKDVKSIDSVTTPSYKRYYCAVSYSTSSSSNYQKLKDKCEVLTGNNGLRCYDRLTRLKDGMFNFLDSNDPKLENVVVGLGHYSEGDSIRSKILKEASKLGPVNSTHRQALKGKIALLEAWNGTPTSHALAESAAYLLGNSTVRNTTINYYQVEALIEEKTNAQNNKEWRSKTCSSLNNEPTTNEGYRECSSNYGWSSWSSWTTTKPSILNTYSKVKSNGNSTTEKLYYVTKSRIITNDTDSGFSLAPDDSKVTDKTKYKSPLPDKKVSCDGQGIYVLSDGDPNSTSDGRSQSLMSRALGYSNDSDFTCSTGLSNIKDDSGWKCMGAFARKIYDKPTNPLGVSIQTAFVGFGASFTNLSNNNVINACKLGSKKVGDRCSYYADDKLTVNTSVNKNPIDGYGNGGFYTANTANDITTSVLNFIDNLGTDPLEPLPTGSLSVPVDALNPNGLQNVGYLRMLEPNPAQPSLLTWVGNLKKYKMKDGVLVDGSTSVFDVTGNFASNTKNLWGSLAQNDGGKINVGGTYEQLPMPTLTNTTALRNLMTDVGAVSDDILQPLQRSVDGNGKLTSTLLKIPVVGSSTSKDEVLNKFRTQAVLKEFPLKIKLKILNYLGFKVDTALEEFPENDAVNYEGSPYISMGGIIHSFPMQMTYSGVLSENGDLLPQDIELEDGKFIRARKQSVLYGSMEGGLHIVDSLTGEEQMVFVPAEILNNQTASNALVPKGSGTPAPAHGVDSPWVVDATYRNTGTYPASQVIATEMNVYGGLRMGGSSYYGLDVLTPTAPKLKFRIGPDLTEFSRMGQSWSKPVLINIRKDGKPKRALVVGGGYDICYEEPRFTLSSSSTQNDTTCALKTRAQGNAIYVIDADTGERLFWASNTGSDADNSDLRHSVVSRISAIDRDGDGFEDHLYFGDLGGQIFRIDLDNYHEKGSKTFGVRTIRLANLATKADGTQIDNGDNPRFYEPMTLTIHDENGKTFILVGAASGDRSTPLDVAPIEGRDGLSPTRALTNRPTNKVYGVFDLDFIKKDLITNRALTESYTPTTTEQAVPLANRLITHNLTLKDLLANPQDKITGNSTIYTQYFNSTAPKHGWYRSLSWSWDYLVEDTGHELANGTFRQPGGLKAYEEPLAIGNNLFVPVYDPEGTGITPQNPCLPRVVGETDRQQYCLPFGVCVTQTGTMDKDREEKTGFKVESDDNGGYKNSNVIGKGIQGIALANNGGAGGGNNSCGNFTLSSNTAGIGNWQCTRTLNPTRWFEKR